MTFKPDKKKGGRATGAASERELMSEEVQVSEGWDAKPGNPIEDIEEFHRTLVRQEASETERAIVRAWKRDVHEIVAEQAAERRNARKAPA